MIITGLLNVVVTLFTGLVSLFPSIPAFPPAVSDFLDTIQTVCVDGAAILANFCYWNIVITMLGFTLACFSAWHIYQFIRFVLRKIPLLGIE